MTTMWIVNQRLQGYTLMERSRLTKTSFFNVIGNLITMSFW